MHRETGGEREPTGARIERAADCGDDSKSESKEIEIRRTTYCIALRRVALHCVALNRFQTRVELRRAQIEERARKFVAIVTSW